ncbi:MAG TPA: hypothetical protein VJ183_19995 [Chloroflexia bacterium]|nr:hypothetical protein [Chloroflexia bacterium]
MEKLTVRGMFEDGEVTFAGPVDVEGCWSVEITFLEREDGYFEANPHRHEALAVPDRLEELHRQMESQKPPVGPY